MKNITIEEVNVLRKHFQQHGTGLLALITIETLFEKQQNGEKEVKALADYASGKTKFEHDGLKWKLVNQEKEAEIENRGIFERLDTKIIGDLRDENERLRIKIDSLQAHCDWRAEKVRKLEADIKVLQLFQTKEESKV